MIRSNAVNNAVLELAKAIIEDDQTLPEERHYATLLLLNDEIQYSHKQLMREIASLDPKKDTEFAHEAIKFLDGVKSMYYKMNDRIENYKRNKGEQ